MPASKPVPKDVIKQRRAEIARKAREGELKFPGSLREMRQALGMTQAQFAKHFGLTRIQVSDLENGKSNPTLETLNKIGRPFGFEVGLIPKNKAIQ
jgi:DNA-binding XRE family transcriptional regulator